MYQISKEFHFSASHVLAGLAEDHPCGRLHGHNYMLKVVLLAKHLDETGFVIDYGRLKPFSDWLDATLDHRHLNDVVAGNPTAERLSEWLREVARELLNLPTDVECRVAVSETPKTWAEYLP